MGFLELTTFAAWPSLEQPTIVYEVGTQSGRYAEQRLLSGGRARLRRAIRATAGLDPSVEVVMLYGERR